MSRLPYRTLSSYLREKFGQRVQKITLDAGLSCPNRDENKKGGCIYCNLRGSGTGAFAKGTNLKKQIEEQMSYMSRRYKAKAFIAYFQSYSNTYADVDTLKRIYDEILPYPEIVGIAIGTRPDCIDKEKLDLINSYTGNHLVWVEYGLQSASDETLTRINRGHDVRSFIKAVEMTAQHDIRICTHVIIGLPGEGMDQYIDSARLVAGLPVTDIKIHLLYVIKGTPLEIMFNKGLYTPLSMDAYAEAVANFIAYLPESMVIQRITGDPHGDELVAPSWAMEKTQVRGTILDKMKQLKLHQGLFYSRQ